MASHIPFVYNGRDADLAGQFYGDSEVVRLSMHGGDEVASQVPSGAKLWIDAGVDGYDRWPEVSDKWKNAFKGIQGADKLGFESMQKKPQKALVEGFVAGVLSKCLACLGRKPDWISIPQLPAVSGSGRNRVNRELASAAATWRSQSGFDGKLILPLVFTHQDQLNGKTARNRYVSLAQKCYGLAGADGYWAVDSTIQDWTGSRTFEQRRFKGIVNLHEELAAALPGNAISIGGPYWALNLVLWAQGLVRYPAIGVGGRYQYILPGGKQGQQPKRRVALPPLRRTAIVSNKLETWLGSLPATSDLKDVTALVGSRALRLNEAARAQVAHFYKDWYDGINKAKPSGRALSLFQDFSSAYVVGKPLPQLPAEEKTARRPERVAEQFMLFCMPSS